MWILGKRVVSSPLWFQTISDRAASTLEFHGSNLSLQPPARGDLARRDRAYPHLSAAVPGVLRLSARARESHKAGDQTARTLAGKRPIRPDPVVIVGVDKDRSWIGSAVFACHGAGWRP